MLDADMLGRCVAEDILTAAEVRHGHTIAMIAFEEYDWMKQNIDPWLASSPLKAPPLEGD